MGGLSTALFEEMRDNVDEINIEGKSKGEIKDRVSDWGEEQLIKETAVLHGMSRQSIHKKSKLALAQSIFADTALLRKRMEKRKAREQLHSLRAEIFRERIRTLRNEYDVYSDSIDLDVALDINHIIEKAIKDRDMSSVARERLRAVEFEGPVEGDKYTIVREEGSWF
jgi:hypothetical protein